LYGEKNPKCVEQFSAFRAALPAMESLSLEEIHDKYHNGTALPAAPKHCYLARSQVVHPVMNLVRFNGQWSEEARATAIEEFEEVVEHLARIQRNLDNPPN
jgi:hypothetical protein